MIVLHRIPKSIEEVISMHAEAMHLLREDFLL